jgi:hypothetical protein
VQGRSVSQSLKRIAQSRRSPSELQLAVAKYKAGVQSAQEVLPIYPNPGSQAYLMFDVLGFKKGQPKVISYPTESTKDAIAIIEKEGIDYPYPEVLKDEAIAYELLPPDEFVPKARMINVHCGNGVGKTAISLAIAYIMTRINPKGKGLISANTYPQLEKSTIPAIIEMCKRFNIPFGTAREPNKWSGKELNDAEVMSAAKSIAHYEKGMVINGCYHYVLSADNFMGGSSKRAQSGRGLQVSWVILDEYARTPDASAFQAVVTRVRQKGSEPLIILPSTINTDNPFNWVYEIFDNPGRAMEQRVGKISIEGSTIENRHNNAPSYVRNMYGSMPKPMFLAEVFGKYIEIAENRLIEEAWIEAALNIQLYSALPPLMGDQVDFRKRAGLDVANSTSTDKGDASVLTILTDAMVTEILEYKLDTYSLAEEVDKYMRCNRIASVCYDGDGLGVGTGNNLSHIGDRRYNVVAANGSRAASSEEVVKDFRGNPIKMKDFLYNERAELGWRLRERFKKTYAMMTGTAHYPDAELISIPNHPELLRQLRAVKFLRKNGKIILVPKEEIIRQLGRSPDHYDSLTYAFANAATSDYSDLGWIADVYG